MPGAFLVRSPAFRRKFPPSPAYPTKYAPIQRSYPFRRKHRLYRKLRVREAMSWLFLVRRRGHAIHFCPVPNPSGWPRFSSRPRFSPKASPLLTFSCF